MKLVDILARELRVWPEEWDAAQQGSSGRIYRYGGSEWISTQEIADDQLHAIVTRAEWRAAVDALDIPKFPSDNPKWTGEGLPPVGIDVDVVRSDCSWIAKDEWQIGKSATVMAAFCNSAGHDMVAIQFDGGHCECILAKCLRPILTPEQIAAEVRQRAIDEMVEAKIAGGLAPWVCAELYDAGYRKFEIVE